MASRSETFATLDDDDDNDFQIPLAQTTTTSTHSCRSLISSRRPLKSSNSNFYSSKKLKRTGKENVPESTSSAHVKESQSDTPSLPNPTLPALDARQNIKVDNDSSALDCDAKRELLKTREGYLCNSVESRLMNSRVDFAVNDDFEVGPELDVLLNLSSDVEEGDRNVVNGEAFHPQERNGLDGDGVFVQIRCPLCGIDISGMSNVQRQIHSNDCLDKGEAQVQDITVPSDESEPQIHRPIVDISPVLEWVRSLGLERYGDIFAREEIDWDTLQWLTEEDLFGIGITALGPRKKIMHALSEHRKGSANVVETHSDMHTYSEPQRQSTNGVQTYNDASDITVDETKKLAVNKLITDYFPGSVTDGKKVNTSVGKGGLGKRCSDSGLKHAVAKNIFRNGKLKDVPSWCCISGTPFRVDAFRYLRGDCSHWFLTHFHMDHYQGLTRSFCHGKIYCSSITATLVNIKIGIPWDRLQILQLNQKINIAGVDVTCLDANHCPGSIMILFEPPNGKAILHTGDFRFCQEMTSMPVLQSRPIHTLILDTTYCNPQYDFPKQEAVIQFVIDCIQAEAFNPKTLFLIGSYTIGKERLFLEVARVLRKKVYVTAAKLHILRCLGFSEEDMQWFTVNEQESHIHVVPMWTLASFKRLKHISDQYVGRFSLIVAFSPTGWTFGKGKKKSPGRRWQQGTVIRYEVPYSEHCSFTELRDFFKLVSPMNVIPSVNNDGPDSANAMISLLSS
ncbi:DNA cross-link repair protein SNM1 isoform X1 [Carya illinoinensis]|uniref:DNA cross-link repair protein SNM1 isoform X1 n=1 Tax=Carya illinoinensis TaxID=32201 RepID=UPI001C71821D|nr:DNA cross-link repair protein SNM1 isoform X1 [Carya illinoinensis]